MFIVILSIAMASSLILGGWLFRPANLMPKMSKLDPIKGIKRIVSLRSVVELVKSSLKVTVIFTILYLYLNNHLQPLLGMQRLGIEQGSIQIMNILFDGLILMYRFIGVWAD